MDYAIKRLENIRARVEIPPDKSISHRAVILSAIAEGKTRINNFLESDDTKATLDCLNKLGVKIKQKGREVIIEGRGKFFPRPKNEPLKLNANESGTTMRVLSGLLCAQNFSVEFEGRAGLNQRPMARIIEPLRKMGANIEGKFYQSTRLGAQADICPPLLISPASTKLKGINYDLPVSSAQVKSAIILAALYADKPTSLKEPYPSRDHTELMLEAFGVRLENKSGRIICWPAEKLKSPGEITIAGDFSSAAFFIVLGLILKNSEINIQHVNLNPTRCGLLNVLRRMGANIEEQRLPGNIYGKEPCGNLKIKSSSLAASTVGPEEIPAMIDEIPILSVAAAFAEGDTIITGLDELKVKEADRLESIHSMLRAAGVETRPFAPGGIEIRGGAALGKANFDSFNDHRMAMSAIVLGSKIGGCKINEVKCINKSFPNFISLMKSLHSS